MATFSAFWALFLQIVHSSMDCLKRFRRQKPLHVGKLAVVCMQIALGDKTSVLETTLWFMQRKTIARVWGGGIAPSPENVFDFESKMATFSAFWALAHVARRDHAPSPPWIRQWLRYIRFTRWKAVHTIFAIWSHGVSRSFTVTPRSFIVEQIGKSAFLISNYQRFLDENTAFCHRNAQLPHLCPITNTRQGGLKWHSISIRIHHNIYFQVIAKNDFYMVLS